MTDHVPSPVAPRKPYKARAPLDTIEDARGILRDLDLFTIEYHMNYAGPDVCSCRVYLADEAVEALNIGTNGKALSRRYALASAYGEFMERLQNGALISRRQLRLATRRHLELAPPPAAFARRLDDGDLRLDFTHSPDESYLDQEEVLRECRDLVARILGDHSEDVLRERLSRLFGDRQVGCIPFYSVREDRVRTVPAELVWPACGTNGMCGGNTPAEALIQGISEVFERYAYRRLFLDGIVPPPVPLELFEGTEVHDHILSLERATGLVAEVRDCSLGMGLPVIGLLLTAPKAGRYVFHLGSDPSPATALSRCLTELFQGEQDKVLRRFHAIPEGLEDPRSHGQLLHALWRAFYDSCADWPAAVVQGEPTYEFAGFPDDVALSDDVDVAYMARLVLDAGHDLLVRDCSYLGFPAFQVYVPGMTEIDRLFEGEELGVRARLDAWTHVLTDLKSAEADEARELARALEDALGALPEALVSLHHWLIANRDAELTGLRIDEVLTLLWVRAAEYGRAAGAAERLLAGGGESIPRRYWMAVRDYCAAREDGGEAALAAVRAEYGETLWSRVAERYGAPDDVFAFGDWPSCFRCDECDVASSCAYFDLLAVARRLQERYAAGAPDQLGLSGLFTDARA